VINNDSHLDPIDHFYPSIAVNSQGVVTVTWYDRREDQFNESARLYMAQSFDFGGTWSNTAVSSQPTDLSTVGDQNGGFGIGEYNQVLTTDGYAIPVWVDGRKGDGDLDIYAAFVPISKDGLSVGTRREAVKTLVDRIRLYPSPASQQITAAFELRESTDVTVSVVNQIGQVVMNVASGTLTTGSNAFKLDVGGLANGTYYLIVKSSDGVEETPFVVSH
jgi:hypothetical protein